MTWKVTQSQLHALESLVMEKGYDWLYVPMVTGQVPSWMAVDHLIRFVSNLTVTLDGVVNAGRPDVDGLWTATIQAEQYKIDPLCLLEQMCDTVRSCLVQISFKPMGPYPKLLNWPIDQAPMLAAWGIWSNDNG